MQIEYTYITRMRVQITLKRRPASYESVQTLERLFNFQNFRNFFQKHQNVAYTF